MCWLAARSQGGQVVLRLEDVDFPRCREEFAQAILEDLTWLGLTWDEGPDIGGPYSPYCQKERTLRYLEVLAMLENYVYPCFCSRKDMQGMASAPHGDGGAYPGTCRPHAQQPNTSPYPTSTRPPAWRLILPEQVCIFHDLIQGPISLSAQTCGGDFPVRRADGIFAYQLAVAVDDMDHHITLVVRGADLLTSTPRQRAIFHYLGRPSPQYAHVPLLLGPDGQRLAKRHASLSLRALRACGVSPQTVIGLLGWYAGFLPAPQPASLADLCSHFTWTTIPQDSITLGDEAMHMLH